MSIKKGQTRGPSVRTGVSKRTVCFFDRKTTTYSPYFNRLIIRFPPGHGRLRRLSRDALLPSDSPLPTIRHGTPLTHVAPHPARSCAPSGVLPAPYASLRRAGLSPLALARARKQKTRFLGNRAFCDSEGDQRRTRWSSDYITRLTWSSSGERQRRRACR